MAMPLLFKLKMTVETALVQQSAKQKNPLTLSPSSLPIGLRVKNSREKKREVFVRSQRSCWGSWGYRPSSDNSFIWNSYEDVLARKKGSGNTSPVGISSKAEQFRRGKSGSIYEELYPDLEKTQSTESYGYLLESWDKSQKPEVYSYLAVSPRWWSMARKRTSDCRA